MEKTGKKKQNNKKLKTCNKRKQKTHKKMVLDEIGSVSLQEETPDNSLF